MPYDEKSISDFEATLKSHARQLVESLEQGRFGEAVEMIHRLNQARDYGLYVEVGKLTRELHNAIVKLDLDARYKHGEPSQMADANDRLSYVVEMTEKAANRTMDLVEECMPLADYVSQEAQSLATDWKRFMQREMNADQFRDLTRRIDQFLSRSLDSGEQLSGHLRGILLAQDFQDLTGQVIKRVTQLITEVEVNLLQLVVMAGKVDRFAGIQHDHEQMRTERQMSDKKVPSRGEGPQIHADKRDDVVTGQDDVDDLLSSLGF
ncbi:protein phosphatase CheZ [Azomonas macrocytogenes]|uniref:Protein phosphatase CheZ n=1 Tax=Azomonas macrocytogenes TaxID=69962 RepID=A0A839SYQ0_AZOMA|nr:protein phosphatase CheZ [Azomonas macrocytogenes]MBB3101819.1 chemotaxis protein CheZ [Azomonas macrocytogenes]